MGPIKLLYGPDNEVLAPIGDRFMFIEPVKEETQYKISMNRRRADDDESKLNDQHQKCD
jgi:hypothetical protein